MSDALPRAAPTPREYDIVTAGLHWTVVAIVLINIFSTPMGETPLEHARAVEAHFTIGLLILVLMCPRLLWRMSHPAPPYPDSVQPWEHKGAALVHWAFYIALFAMGLVGTLQGAVAPYDVELFGVWRMPFADFQNEALYGLLTLAHEALNGIVLVLMVGHVAAALYHGIVKRDGVLRSMLPW